MSPMRERTHNLKGEAGFPRRALLSGFVASYTSALIPWALAQPASDAGHAAFLAMSAIIAGPQTLDPELARRLYDALLAAHGDFASGVQSLLKIVEEQRIEVTRLQQTLEEQSSPVASLPRKIATAWFLGVVGENENARALAFEKALNAVIVADVLRPPTYAYGPYGSWARKPV